MSDPAPPWIEGPLHVTREALGEVERAARAGYARDEEACGYLTGPGDSPLLVDRAVELENLANRYHAADPEGHPRTGREYFKIHGLRFERAVREAEGAGRPVKAFFHSHLDCGAYFSEEDAASMTGGGAGPPAFPLLYLVTAVDGGVVTAHRAFRYDARTGGFPEVALVVLAGPR